MTILGSFIDGLFTYNCSNCGGLCCNLNSSLVFESEIFDRLTASGIVIHEAIGHLLESDTFYYRLSHGNNLTYLNSNFDVGAGT